MAVPRHIWQRCQFLGDELTDFVDRTAFDNHMKVVAARQQIDRLHFGILINSLRDGVRIPGCVRVERKPQSA